MEEDYYKLLDLDYNSSLEDINNRCKIKLSEFKFLPFLTNSDKEKIKQIKKAQFIFNDENYKNIYDQNYKNINDQNNTTKIDKKKNIINQNDYIINRIFGEQSSSDKNNFSIFYNELLRPKNVGLISDKISEIDYDVDLNETEMFKETTFSGEKINKNDTENFSNYLHN